MHEAKIKQNIIRKTVGFIKIGGLHRKSNQTNKKTNEIISKIHRDPCENDCIAQRLSK